jgi:N-acyl homoserine lactone hydrolase
LVAQVPVPVVCFSTGVVRTKRATRGPRRYLAGGWRDDVLPVNVFVLRHPEGVCLFDAGQTARASSSRYFPRWHPYFRLARFELEAAQESARQLEGAGLRGARVRWLVLSHLHTDHVGGLSGLRADEVIVSRVEWERATGLRGRLRGYLPQFWPAGLTPRPIDFHDDPVGPFAGSLALTGDGTLTLVPMPGHTPGHMGLLARLDGRRFLLIGDFCESADLLHRVDPALDEFCRREAVTVLATHDPQAERLIRGTA